MKQNRTMKKIIKYMKNLGIYRVEFTPIIKIYCSLLDQYETLESQFYEEGATVYDEYTNKNGATNARKTPTYLSLETLRKDIAMYSDKLGLNPKSLNNIVGKAEEGEDLSKILKDI